MLIINGTAELMKDNGSLQKGDRYEFNMFSVNMPLEDQLVQIPTNLASIYVYCSEQLLAASLSNDIDKLNEIAQILIPIKSGWDNIPLDTQQEVSF